MNSDPETAYVNWSTAGGRKNWRKHTDSGNVPLTEVVVLFVKWQLLDTLKRCNQLTKPPLFFLAGLTHYTMCTTPQLKLLKSKGKWSTRWTVSRSPSHQTSRGWVCSFLPYSAAGAIYTCSVAAVLHLQVLKESSRTVIQRENVWFLCGAGEVSGFPAELKCMWKAVCWKNAGTVLFRDDLKAFLKAPCKMWAS